MDIYTYLKNKLNIDIGDNYTFKRDYINNPLYIAKNGYNSEQPFKEDLEYLYIELNISRKDLLQLFNVTLSPFSRWINIYNIRKDKKKVQENVEKTNNTKYNVKSTLQLQQIRDLSKQTCLNRYGNENYNNRIKAKQTNIKRYGVENPIMNSNIFNKVKMTKFIKYGNENYNNQPKKEQTCIERYGVSSYTQTKDYIVKTKRTNYTLYNNENYNNQTKMKQTCLDRYGVDNYTKSDELKENNLRKYGVEYYFQTDEQKLKSYNTKKQNNTYGQSLVEDLIYENLCTRFDKVLRQYCSNDYPYACDFYIPEIDTYIEYNGYWTHGKEPFDFNNISHINKVKLWEQHSKELNFKGKPKNQYKRAIKTWTITDPNKRQIAKQNGLNYLEFFNLQEFNQWFNNICK